jgi:hypothetical protein
MICSNCGADVAPSTGFCRRCGTLVGQPAPLPGSARFTETAGRRAARLRPGPQRVRVSIGDFIAIAGAIVALFAIFGPWYRVTVRSSVVPARFHIHFTTPTILVKPLAYPAGGWRWAIFGLAAIVVVDSLLSIITTARKKRSPRWPHAGTLFIGTFAMASLTVLAYFLRPYPSIRHAYLLIEPQQALYVALGGAGFALVGAAIYSTHGPMKTRLS